MSYRKAYILRSQLEAQRFLNPEFTRPSSFNLARTRLSPAGDEILTHCSTQAAWNSPPDLRELPQELSRSPPRAEPQPGQRPRCPPHPSLTLECGSEKEACVNSTISITWHGLCLLPAGVSVVMAKACDRGLPGDEKCFICILAVREGSQAASSLPSITAQKGPASPT